ncbi:glycosyltransferase family 4 protein [Brevibacterium litoralis]|uniref:glycosyltransferase family 4 protein n=1 Tax=Brevibacterium litoralis TaxID=3138935 RepID=UPI0032EAB745
MRIALFTETFLPKIDGVVTRLMGTLDELAGMGHEVVVFAPGHPPARYAGFRVEPVRSVSFKPWYPELNVGLPTPRIARTMERFHPHVVHVVNPVWLAAYGALSSLRRDLPMLASFHTDVPEYTQRLGLSVLTNATTSWIRQMHNLAEVNLCTSQQMVEKAEGLGIGNVNLWPKAVDTRGYTPDNYSADMRSRLTEGHPEDKLLVYVGRMSKEKDLDVLRPVIENAPAGTRLAMVGSGPHIEELKAEFAGTNTLFTGYMSGKELAQAYASADVFVFPSTTETLGLVALESMASGVPVVGADAGGIPFAVPDGVGGLLAAPRDPVDMSAKVNRLLTDEAERARLAAGGRENVLQFGWRESTEKLVRHYEEAIDLHWTDHVEPRWRIKTFGKPMPRAL